MNTARISAMSPMKSDDREARKTYATLRVVGDALNPEDVTKILLVVPTISYAKGAKYNAGKRTGELVGKTGVWAFSTDGLVASNHLLHHLGCILGILIPSRQDALPFVQLHAFLAKNKGLRAELRCFWHGSSGARKPSIPKNVSEILKFIPATIDTDFGTDAEKAGRKIA